MDDDFFNKSIGGWNDVPTPASAPPTAPPPAPALPTRVSAPTPTADDFYTKPVGGWADAPAPQMQTTPSPEGAWSDYAHYAAHEFHGMRADVNAFAASIASDPQDQQRLQTAAENARADQQASLEAMSPAGRTSATSPILSGQTLAHPGRALAYGAESLGLNVAPYVAAGAVGGPGAMAALGYVQGAGEARNQITQAVMDAPDSKLQGVDPDFSLVKKYMSDHDARQWLANKVIEQTGADKWAGAAGAAMGGAGGVELSGAASKIGLGAAEEAALTGTKLDSITKAAGRGAAEMGVPGAVTQAVTQHAQAQAGAAEDPTAGDIFGAGATQALGGALFAGAVAPFHHAGTLRDGRQSGGETRVGRDPDDIDQIQAKSRAKTTAPEGAQAGTKSVPSSPVGATEKAALDGKPIGVDVTQGSKPPAEPVKQPPPVVQPTPPPSPTATEAPRTVDTTEQAPPPPPPPEGQPAPAAAAPAAVPPIDPALVARQQAELVDPSHPRDAAVYPKGAQVPDLAQLPDNWRYGKVKLPGDGGTVVYDHSPRGSGWRKDSIKAAAKDGTLQDRIDAQASKPPDQVRGSEPPLAGAKPAPAPERAEAPGAGAETAPPPPEVVQSKDVQPEGVSQTREEPVTQASKPPEPELLTENKAGVRLYRNPDPEGKPYLKVTPGRDPMPMGEETAKLLFPDHFGVEPYTGEKSEAEKIREAAQAEAERLGLAQPKGRVLRSQTPEEERAAAAQAEADRAAAERVATEQPAKPATRQTKEPEQQKPGKKSEAQKEAMRASNAVADEVVRNNLPQAGDEHAPDPARGSGGKGSREQLKTRVQKMVKEATEGGFQFMKMLKDRKGEGLAHSASSVLLHEAKRLADIKVAKTSDYKRFLDRERDLLKGEAAKEGVLKERRAAGKEFAAAAGKGVKEVATESDEGGEARQATKEGVSGGAAIEAPDVAEEMEKAKEAVAEEKVAQAPGEKRELTENERRAQEASERARAKLAEQEAKETTTKLPEAEVKEGDVRGFAMRTVGFTVEKRRTIKKPDADLDTDMMERPQERVKTVDLQGRLTDVPVLRTTTAKDVILKHLDLSKYSNELRPMIKRLVDAVTQIAGDTPVHYVDHEELRDAIGKYARGLYDNKYNQIFLSDKLNHDTPLHEVFHAATNKVIRENPQLARLMDRLRGEMQDAYDRDTSHIPIETAIKIEKNAFQNSKEFLTYLMTNEKVQDYFKKFKISDELARDIGIPKWRKATLWNGVIDVIRQALGMEPRDTSAIEAAMAISENLMWARDPGMAMEAAGRMLPDFQRVHDRDQERFIRTPTETFRGARGITRDVATQFTKDKLTNLSDKLLHGSMHVFSGTWLNDMHGHLFEDAKGKILDAINQARNKVSSTYHSLMDSDKDIITRGFLLDRIYASAMPDYARLVNLSTVHNIHADRAAPTIPKNPEDAARKNWQGHKFYDEARTIYDHLPKELQQRYTAEKRFYMDKQAQSARAIINKVMPLFAAPKGSTLEDVIARARDNDLTEADWAHYEKLGVDAPLHKAMNLMSRKDVYFNSQREGRYVTTGRYEMPAGGAETAYSGELLPDNKREFDTEKEAHAYVTGTKMKAVTREVHYFTDKATGETKRIAHKEATSIPGTETVKYQVRLERDNTQMATSKAEALRNRQAMEADGVKELSGVLDKRDEQAWSKLNTADQKAIERKIDGNDDLTPAERSHLKEITRQLMLSGQGGMGAHMIQARKVAGAKFDNGLGLQAYARAANFHMAREEHASEINEGMNRLEAHERANRTDADATRRSIVANEYRNRVYKNPDTLNSKTHPLFQKLMTWAFVNFLMRPSHVFLSQIHPYVYSVPMIGARHGYWKALQGQYKAMSDLGGTMHNLWEGTKAGYDVYKSGKERDIDKAVQMAHGVDPIRVMISRLKNPEEREFLNTMWQTQHLHSAFDASVFGGDGLDRANAVIRQFTDAMEANNRLSTALNAYRLEKSMHNDRSGALAYSRRVIEETHGVFSSTNTAPWFKNPIIRGAMQFRQQPMNLATTMYRNIGKAAMGDTEARWTLAYHLGTAALLGGMGGMPMDLPKLAGLASQALGGPSPSDYADKLHRFMASYLGETGANGIEEGLPGLMGPLGPSVGHRTGWDGGFFFGEPKSDNVNDMYSYAAQMAAGASGGMAVEWLTALHDLEQGNYERAGEGVLPGMFKDFLKSYRLATEGTMTGKQQVRPASYGDALLQAFGFSGVERQQALAGHYALQKAQQALPPTKGEQLKQKHASKTVLGVPVSKKNAALAAEYQSAYQ